ncbi:hypothetical protein Cgig2_004633 [Carnegiea gigantea]|uniref:Uncharacterized protein n=1 Tax=Carnegiea gigantea TaxID=171969 RepID=A0A9Q1Q9L4_9CARY|nr:hypothetical protein Cgig2_004633 [Carnegiea gigantea]
MASTSQLSETLPQFLADIAGVMDEVQVVDVAASEGEQPDDMDEFEQREWDDAETETETDDDEINYFCTLQMTDRDPRRQQRRRGGSRLSDADSHSPEAVGVGERTYGSPVRDPLTAAATSSFMPTPRVDARFGNPFVDPNQVPVLNQDAGAGGVNTTFWNTFGSFVSCNANLIMSALGSMQQSTPHPTPHHIPHPTVVPTPQRTPEPQAQATSQQSRGRMLPWSEHEVAVRDKSLIEPEGDTYILYYRFTKYEMLVERNSILVKYYYWLSQHDRQVRNNFDISGAKQLKNLFAYARKLNEIAMKAAEEARQAKEAHHKEIEDLRKAIEEKEVKFQHELAQEKAASKLWKLFKSQQTGSSTAPLEDDDEDDPDPSHQGDSSDD